jgi:AraC-like DNA-binding protein
MTPRFVSSGSWDHCLFGKTVYPARGRHEPRIQRDYQLILLVSGSVDDIEHELGPGDAILQFPKRREYYRFSDETESEHTWVQIAPELLSPRDKRLLQGIEGAHRTSPPISLLIEEGLLWRGDNAPTAREALLALGRACLLRFADDVRHANTDAASTAHPALTRALEVASAHYAELHSAEDLARRAGISASRLRSLCRAAGQESPSDLVWRLKAEHAVRMIRSTGLTLAEIAGSCGYANPFHLSRAVKRHTGFSPRMLRRSERGR